MRDILIGAFFLTMLVACVVWMVDTVRTDRLVRQAEAGRQARHERFLAFLATVRRNLGQ